MADKIRHDDESRIKSGCHVGGERGVSGAAGPIHGCLLCLHDELGIGARDGRQVPRLSHSLDGDCVYARVVRGIGGHRPGHTYSLDDSVAHRSATVMMVAGWSKLAD